MTKEELLKTPFLFQSYDNTISGCTTIYRAKDDALDLRMYIYVPFHDGAPSGKEIVHYTHGGKVFKDVDKLIAHINRTIKMKDEEEKELSNWCIQQAEETSFLTTQEEKELYASSIYLAAQWGKQVY